MEIHHIGYVVKSIDKAIATFEALGYGIETEIVYDELRDIDIIFLNNNGTRIELVCPKSDKAVSYGILKRSGSSPYHICYIVDDLCNGIENLKQKGFMLTDDIKPAVAIESKNVCFLYKRDIGVIELLER